MVQRFVEMEQYIRATLAILKKDLPIPTNDEWKLLSDLIKILQPFHQATETISGEKYMTGSLVIVMTRCLIAASDKLTTEPILETSKDVLYRLRTGLVTRFGLVERSKTFRTCTFLDPRYKLSVFSDQNEAKNTKNHIQDILVAMIAQESSQEEQLSSITASNIKTDGFRAILHEIMGQKQHKVGTPLSRAIKEIDTYLNDDLQPIFHGDKWSCPLEWWRGHKFTYPHLAKLFQKYGNIMASSVPCERIFSKTGFLLNDRRTRLTSQKVRQLTFLNVNLDENRFT
ncbi:unnamed protein product [Parnassius mnemosyne]|uniref:HAT C-terminal dimerisation domain-containing protein n=1 Tax=Parnassius mnemosyne TaxID=213953 RepID=A0AAV1M9K7_9NEOP